MKLPHFAFYPSDFFMKTLNLSDEQVGRYIRLLCNQWTNGPLDNVPEYLEKYFVKTDSGWINERLEEERNIAKEKHQIYSDRGKKGADARWNATSMQQASKKHSSSNSNQNQNQSHNHNTESKEKKESRRKSAPISKRIQDFKLKILKFRGDYSDEMLKEFFEYWTEHGENDSKFRMEKEKSFGIERRLKTWKEKSKDWKKNKADEFPDKWDSIWVSKYCQDPQKFLQYEKHLISLGFKKKSGASGTIYTK